MGECGFAIHPEDPRLPNEFYYQVENLDLDETYALISSAANLDKSSLPFQEDNMYEDQRGRAVAGAGVYDEISQFDSCAVFGISAEDCVPRFIRNMMRELEVEINLCPDLTYSISGSEVASLEKLREQNDDNRNPLYPVVPDDRVKL